ncbi:MAG: tRNA (guanine(10)-N(2))-dimethyltransferase [Candidatus Diapherotrites archaeon]|nr:tRNA (guanine(10)-N(2))-dimethyltransferase [Candidatus Diapherotrites archaeon]
MIITEGKTKLSVPEHNEVFFNPQMKLNRDITISIVNAWPKKGAFCDTLSGIGAKGIRVANETDIEHVLLNDLNPHAQRFMKKSITLNNLDNVSIEKKDANILLSEHKYDKFDIIDIDPFGSPAQFIDSAIRAILPKNGLLCVTATDTGALCGSFQNAALRKYGIKAKKTTFYNEFGVRALVGFCVREAAKYDIALIPVFSHATRHYYRVFLKTERGRTAATKAMKMVGHIGYCYTCDMRKYNHTGKCCNRDVEVLGPIWQGKIYDKKLVRKMEPVSSEAEKLIMLCTEESEFVTPYYNIHAIEKKHKIKAGSFKKIIASLGKASRTHFSNFGIKTDAPFRTFIRTLFQQQQQQR